MRDKIKKAEYDKLSRLNNPEKFKERDRVQSKRHASRRRKAAKRRYDAGIKPQMEFWNRMGKEYHIWKRAQQRAHKHNLPFTIKLEDIIIPTHCPILGMELSLLNVVALADSPSLDKIIPELGYTPDNIQIISHKANTMKSNATFREIELLYNYMKELQ